MFSGFFAFIRDSHVGGWNLLKCPENVFKKHTQAHTQKTRLFCKTKENMGFFQSCHVNAAIQTKVESAVFTPATAARENRRLHNLI